MIRVINCNSGPWFPTQQGDHYETSEMGANMELQQLECKSCRSVMVL